MTDARLRAIVRDMRAIEAAHEPTPEYWTDERTAEHYGDANRAEAERILSGGSAFTHPDVDRLAQIAAEVSKKR